MKRLLTAILVLASACSTPSRDPSSADWKDEYGSFAELAASNREGIDYEVRRRRTGSVAMVMAIHGGNIEPGTAELAESIAGKDLAHYIFVGKAEDPWKLHLTSTRYDDPALLEMAAESDRCLSLHGYRGEQAAFCVGGGDVSGRSYALRQLEIEFPEMRGCELCCPPNSGVSKDNVVNRCRRPGVQVELSPSTRDRIRTDAPFRARLAKALRAALQR